MLSECDVTLELRIPYFGFLAGVQRQIQDKAFGPSGHPQLSTALRLLSLLLVKENNIKA